MTRWTRIFVGVVNPATGKKEMVQTKRLIVRAVSKDKQPTRAASDDEQPEIVRQHLCSLFVYGIMLSWKLTMRPIAQGIGHGH